jgi:hypothetical protein
LYTQASFAESWFPDGTVVGTDVDFFVLPGTDPNAPTPLVAGGDSLVQFSDDPDVSRLMAYLISPERIRGLGRARRLLQRLDHGRSRHLLHRHRSPLRRTVPRRT